MLQARTGIANPSHIRYGRRMNVPARYTELINAIRDATGLSDDMLHVHAGLLVMICVRVLSGKRLDTLVPLAAIGAFEAGNEILNRLYYGSWRWHDTGLDILNTMLWPTVLFIALRCVGRRRVDPVDPITAPEASAV